MTPLSCERALGLGCAKGLHLDIVEGGPRQLAPANGQGPRACRVGHMSTCKFLGSYVQLYTYMFIEQENGREGERESEREKETKKGHGSLKIRYVELVYTVAHQSHAQTRREAGKPHYRPQVFPGELHMESRMRHAYLRSGCCIEPWLVVAHNSIRQHQSSGTLGLQIAQGRS